MSDISLKGNLPRLGLVLCQQVGACPLGGCSAEVLDLPALLASIASGEPDLAFADLRAYPCSPTGLTLMSNEVHKHDVQCLLLAGCSPRLAEKHFRRHLLDQPGNGSLQWVQVIDLQPYRDQSQALEQVEMELARLATWTSTHPCSVHVIQSALVLGGGLAGLSAAVTLAGQGIPVSLAFPEAQPGGSPACRLVYTSEEQVLLEQLHQSALNLSNLRLLPRARLEALSGGPGDYLARLGVNGNLQNLAIGAILVAGDATPPPIPPRRGAALPVSGLLEFSASFQPSPGNQPPNSVVWIIESNDPLALRAASLQAIAHLSREPDDQRSNALQQAFLLLPDLPEAPDQDANPALTTAQKAGVQVFRYVPAYPPGLNAHGLEIYDPLTGGSVLIQADQIVRCPGWLPPPESERLASLLHLPRDTHGFIREPRWRLRPERYMDDGIFVIGGTHATCLPEQALFQAALAAAEAVHFLLPSPTDWQAVNLEGPKAEIDASLCTGCGSCVMVCPSGAIRMVERQSVGHVARPIAAILPGGRADVLSLSRVDPRRCLGCGACLPACSTRCISLPGWSDQAIMGQISAALATPSSDGEGRIIFMACEWSASAAFELAARRIHLPADVRLLRLPCSARFDPDHVLWAFLNGAEGVLLGACPKGECHYGEAANHAFTRFDDLKRRLQEERGLPDFAARLRLVTFQPDNPSALVREINNFRNHLNLINQVSILALNEEA